MMNKFAPQHKATDLDPMVYVKSYEKALSKEQEVFKTKGIGIPGLTGKDIAAIKGLGTDNLISTTSLTTLAKILKSDSKRQSLSTKYGLSEDAKPIEFMKKMFDELYMLKSINTAKVPRKYKGMAVKHSGGLISQTGPYYLEGGEIVIPKKMSTGGNDFGTALSMAGNQSPGLQGSSSIEDISSKIAEAISSAGDDLVDKLSSTEFEPLKIDEESRKIDINTDEAAASFAEQIGSAISSTELKIIPPDESAMTAKIDIDAAAIGDTIKSSIEGAEMPSVKVEAELKDNTVELKNNIVKLDKNTVTVEGGVGSVGADKLDSLAEAVNNMTETMYDLNEKTTEAMSKVEMLNTDVGNIKNESLTADVVKQIAEDTVNINVASLTSDINNANTNSDFVRSRVEQMSGRINHMDEKFEQELGNIKSQSFSFTSST